MTAVLLYDHPGSICSQMARLALAEKGVAYTRRTVDIMDRAEQFEPWYTSLNPRAVVPTLVVGETVITDTINIVAYVDREFAGPPLTPADLARAEAMDALMRAIMGLHYGVLLYQNRREPDGSVPIVEARGRFLRNERARHPDRADLLDRRIAGNERMQGILADPAAVARHVDEARNLIDRMNGALAQSAFVAAGTYSLADTFATAALARFRIHGFEPWWTGGTNPHVGDYYQRVKARPSWATAAIVDTGTESDL